MTFPSTRTLIHRCGGSPNYEREKDDGQVDDGDEAHGSHGIGVVVVRTVTEKINVRVCVGVKMRGRSDNLFFFGKQENSD